MFNKVKIGTHILFQRMENKERRAVTFTFNSVFAPKHTFRFLKTVSSLKQQTQRGVNAILRTISDSGMLKCSWVLPVRSVFKEGEDDAGNVTVLSLQ